MNILLKPRNQPREPGWYLCQRVGTLDSRPELVRISRMPELWYHGHITTIPLSRCEHSALWSDRIEIDYPEGFKA
jgi:hypothetical protein